MTLKVGRVILALVELQYLQPEGQSCSIFSRRGRAAVSSAGSAQRVAAGRPSLTHHLYPVTKPAPPLPPEPAHRGGGGGVTFDVRSCKPGTRRQHTLQLKGLGQSLLPDVVKPVCYHAGVSISWRFKKLLSGLV